MRINKIYREIFKITQLLIESNFSIAQNFPVIKENVITWENQKDISFCLKNKKYKLIYREIDFSKNYNIKLIDGSFIQLMYSFKKNDNNKLSSHRLAYYPRKGGDTEFFIRFDYDAENTSEHSSSHVHFGKNRNCRIPVTSPLEPSVFISFVINNFYNKKISLSHIKYFEDLNDFNKQDLLHFNLKY